MAADIDDFIRNQKQKMYVERQRLGPGTVPNGGGGPPAPIRRQDNVGAILKEDVPHPEDLTRGVGMSVESKKALIDGRDGGAALPGLGERQYGTSQQARQRNQDYNAFKAAEDAKFQNRFSNRKVQQPAVPTQPAHMTTLAQQYQYALPQQGQMRAPQSGPPQGPPPAVPLVQPQNFNGNLQPDPFPAGPAGHEEPPPSYDRKLLELERTVAQLRDQMSRRGPHPASGPAPGPPRQGWATPDYNDLVAAKRKEEARRHRLEDPELYGALISDHERRFEDLDAQLNSQKVQLLSRRDGRSTRRPPANILEDDDAWLRVGAIPDLDGSLKNLEGRLQGRTQGRYIPGPGTQRRRGPGQSGAHGDNAPMATLAVGQEERVSAKQRRQSNYRQELQRQMAEQEVAKKRERQERLAPPPGATRQQQPPTSQRRVQEEITQLPSMPLQPGLENLPSLSAYNTPADDAYFYYGSKNPLEDALEESLPSQQPYTFQPPPAAGNVAPAAVTARGDETSRKQNRARMQKASSENPMVGASGDDPREAERRRKAEYAAELQRQMQEVAKNKEKARKEQEEYDRKKDAEIAEYFPFQSKSGGGGEPIKRNGEVVADLRRQGGGGGGTARTEVGDGFKLQLSGSFGADTLQNSTRRDPGTQRTPRQQTNVHGDVIHARGGHGVFGQPKTDEEKAKTDNYKEQLRLQIEERKRQKEAEAEKERIQEEKEQKKIEEQAKRIREEFEEEQRRQKEKREEVNRKNEEMWQQAEAKKKQEADRKRRRTPDDSNRPAFQSQPRAQSPPIPSLRKQQGATPRVQSPPLPTHQRQQRVVKSPPASKPPVQDTSRRESHERPDVLRQLERMKRELQTERVKVEDALRGTPPPNPQKQLADSGRYEVIPVSARGRRSRAEDLDVFELARQGRSGPVIVKTHRPRGDLANADVLREFRNLKLRDNEVGREVRKEHPATPLTSDLLEVQQNTYLRQQEEFIKDMQRRPLQMERYETPQENFRAPVQRDPTPRRFQSTDAEVASQYSFDVENLNQRTEERMRRLSRLNGDEVSLQNQDEVLESFMRQRTHITNEAEREPERVASVRNRQTSYDMPTHGVKQTSFGGLHQDERTTSYHPPTPPDNIPSKDQRPPTVELESVTSDVGGPTPVDDSWLNPKHRR